MSHNVDELEAARITLQADLDRQKTQNERNRLGQFATPPQLATQIVQAALDELPARARIRFLDPAFGTGAFYSGLLNVLSPRRLDAASGCEIDPHYGRPAERLWNGSGVKLHLDDFTTVEPPDRDKPNLIICNPPYVRHHHLDLTTKRRLQTAVAHRFGYRMSGLAGLYCYFMLLSQSFMADEGIGAWLVPTEFMEVNYGKPVKQFLLDRVTLLRIHRFESKDVQFGDALVSSAVVLFRNSSPPAAHSVLFSSGGTIARPGTVQRLSRESLRKARKWTQLPRHHPLAPADKSNCLADFFTIKRGIATGCNSFFVLTPAQIETHGIPQPFLRPILPSPRNLSVDEVLAKPTGEPLLPNPLFLLDCPLAEEDVRRKYPSLWAYLSRGAESGITRGYICRHRVPWYGQEKRPPAPFLCTYMGRPTKRSESPFRFIVNHSQATAGNVYLMLYPKGALKHAVAADADLRKSIWKALCSIRSEMLIREGRSYGGGLHKMEPRELANVPAAAIVELLPKENRAERQRSLFPEDVE